VTFNNHFKARRKPLAVIGLTAALLASPLAQAQGANVLKLGSILTVTGPNASIGKEGLAGVEYAVKQVNASGGVRIGSDSYTVQLVNIEGESKQERAVAAAERLISSEKVLVIFTTPASTTTLAVLPTLEKNKTVGMSFVAAAPVVISSELSYSFRSTPSAIDNVGPSALTAFGEQFEKTAGRKPLPFELIGYDNVMIVLGAMKNAGSTDATKMRDALRNVSYQGVLQEYKFRAPIRLKWLSTSTRSKKAGPRC
jgi:ABC-type branched-subunit amino acid transport system substrate-binding protein